MARRTSKRVAESSACEPLRDMYAAAVELRPASWDQVEEGFLRAMELFDANIASGVANDGDRRNGKGDFFNDLLALILENCAQIELHSRSAVPGFIFPRHNLDVTFPATGMPGFLLEAKALGTPKHPKSEQQKPIGRPGSADFPKRIKEAAFKTIDLKAEFDRRRAMEGEAGRGGPGGNLTTWLRTAQPSSYLFAVARVVAEGDLQSVFALARAAAQVMDGVGVYCFTPVSDEEPTTYRPVPVDRDIDLSAVLHRACTDVVRLRGEGEVAPVPESPSPGQAAAAVLDESGIEPEDDEGVDSP